MEILLRHSRLPKIEIFGMLPFPCLSMRDYVLVVLTRSQTMFFPAGTWQSLHAVMRKYLVTLERSRGVRMREGEPGSIRVFGMCRVRFLQKSAG